MAKSRKIGIWILKITNPRTQPPHAGGFFYLCGDNFFVSPDTMSSAGYASTPAAPDGQDASKTPRSGRPGATLAQPQLQSGVTDQALREGSARDHPRTAQLDSTLATLLKRAGACLPSSVQSGLCWA